MHSEIANRTWTSTATALSETPSELDPAYIGKAIDGSEDAPTHSPQVVKNQPGCDQEGGKTPTISPNDRSYLAYCSLDDDSMEKCSVLEMLQDEIYLLPDGLIPLGWSPTGDRLLLADEIGPSVYTADTLGRNPIEVFSVGSDQVENNWGWWLTENEVIVAEQISEEGLRYWQYYRVNLESGLSEPFDRNETWQIYDVATNGGFWIEGWLEIDLVYANYSRTPLWDEGDVAVDVTPYVSYLSIYPNNCGIVFIGCTGEYSQGDLNCSISNALLYSEGVASVATLYPLGDAVYAYSIEASPDSRSVAFIDYWTNLIVIDLLDGHVVYEKNLPFTLLTTPQLVWGPDSTNIAINIDTAEEGRIIIIQSVLTDTMSVIKSGLGTRLVEWRSFSQ